MKAGDRRWPQPALVVSIVALIIALAGMAKDDLGPSSAGSPQPQVGATSSSVSEGRRPAGCGRLVYIGGRCFDPAPSGPVTGVETAVDRCAERGGFLPSPLELIAARPVLDLGDGSGVHSQFTDAYAYDTSGTEPRVLVVSESGEKNPINEDPVTDELIATYEYVCAYELVR